MKTWFIAFALLLTASFSVADALSLKPGAPSVYVVKKGDTLWDIAGMYLDDPWRWPSIWQINDQVSNPNLIYPGDRLNLVMVNGQMRVEIERSGVVRLSPKIRTSELDQTAAAIPLTKLDPFLNKSRITTADELNQSPYVIAGNAARLLSGPGDKLFAQKH